MSADGHRLDSLELASGLVFGLVDDLPAGAVERPLVAFEAAVRDALRRPPCLVSFSGGRDSSAVLAVAVAVARRESLPAPVPVTSRFAADPASREDEWQERVVAHLRLGDWVRLELGDELDCVGPYARSALVRHGVLWPFNAHFHLPLFEAARGGSLLTGVGGDELLGESRWSRAVDVLGGRALPERRDLRRLALYAAPRSVRKRWLPRRFPLEYAWLREEARRELVRGWAEQAASEPRLPRRHAVWRGSFRYQRVGVRSLDLLARDLAVTAVHPFLDERFRAALAAAEPAFRFRSRTEAMRDLFAYLLPDDVLSRASKSSFDGVFFTAASRAFAEEWEGDGLDPAVVDAEALRREWLGDAPDGRSFLALQAAWLATASARQATDEPLDGVVERVPVPGTP